MKIDVGGAWVETANPVEKLLPYPGMRAVYWISMRAVVGVSHIWMYIKCRQNLLVDMVGRGKGGKGKS